MFRPSFLAFMHKFGKEQPLKCVEVGVFSGRNALAMLEYAPNIHLTLVDPYINWSESPTHITTEIIESHAHKILEPYNDRIEWIKDTSEMASRKFDEHTFDYVYLDADHTYDAVRIDIACWLPKLKPGGIMGGHDWVVVRPAVMDELGYYHFNVYALDCYFTRETPKNIMYGDLQDWWIHKEIYEYVDKDMNPINPYPKGEEKC